MTIFYTHTDKVRFNIWWSLFRKHEEMCMAQKQNYVPHYGRNIHLRGPFLYTAFIEKMP